jgi:hypothetical protein
MKYVVHRRFKDNAICGSINLPAMTECECEDGLITYNNTAICYATSENAHQFFAVNEDGMGMERGRLTQSIQKALAKRDGSYQERWDKVWKDSVCEEYRRKDYEDFWLWGHDFFNADIDVLRYIAKLVGAKEAK